MGMKNMNTNNNYSSKEIKGIIEAILFASGDIVNIDKLVSVLEMDKETLKSIINEMIVEYSSSNDRGIIIREINGEYQFCSKPEFSDFVKEFWSTGQNQILSQPAYEVLSIIAYGQSVTRAQIEKIRGVNSDSSVAKLVERGLIVEVGRQDVAGRPVLYGTTDEFLKSFGFSSLDDLPELHPEEIEDDEKTNENEEIEENEDIHEIKVN